MEPSTPEGSAGPIESRLYEFGTVTPFVFGFLGEANKAVRDTIKDMASVGSEYPSGAKLKWGKLAKTKTTPTVSYPTVLRKLGFREA